MTTSRRTFLRLTAGGAIAGLTACGTSGPQSSGQSTGGGSGGGASYWFLTGQPQQAIREAQVKRFNEANSGTQLKINTFQNDAFKQKIKTAIGAGQGPTLIWGWGGGGLKSYVDANQVEDLTGWFGENAELKNAIFPSAFGAATVNGKIYAMPVETTTPIVLFWNKRVFEKVGAEPPQTWGDILDLVPKFNAQGIAPFSLGGQSLDQHDVAGVLVRPDRRQRGVPEHLRRAEGRVVRPVRAEGTRRDAEADPGERVHQGVLLDHRRLQRRPGPAVHGPGRDDAARRVDVRRDEGRRQGLRHRRASRIPELPAGRRRQGRPGRHGRQPGPVPVDLGQGQSAGEGCREEVPEHVDPRRRLGRGVGEVGQHPGGEVRRRQAARSDGPERRGLAEVRVRRLCQRQALHPVLGPSAQPGRVRDSPGQHRQAVPAVHLTATVRRQHERGDRQVTPAGRTSGRSGAPPGAASAPRGAVASSGSPSVTRAGRGPGDVGRAGPVTWMVLPALVVFLVFGVVPLVGALGLSFTTWDGLGTIRPAGLANWGTVLADPGLPHALWVTFEVMALSWLVQTPLSLLIGVFLAGRQRYRAVLAVLFFLPLLLSSAAIAITFKALLDPNFGLGAGLGAEFLAQDWLGRGPLALGVVIFVVSWQFIPFHSLIYQGGVRQIPQSMYEAAAIDGAGRVRQFFSITVPQLKYTIITSSTLMVVGSLTFFDLIFVLTAGGPGDATRVLALDMYQRGFQANLMGPASVIAVILVLLGLALALLLRRLGGSTTASQQEGA